MTIPTFLFHYGSFQPLWHQSGLLQAGPNMEDGRLSLQVRESTLSELLRRLKERRWSVKGVLIHYSDPFILQKSPLNGLRHWPGPKLLACGDLHHGHLPIDTLANYLTAEHHDAVLLTFNPGLLDEVGQRVSVPVRALPPTFSATQGLYLTLNPSAWNCCTLAALGRITPNAEN